MTRALWAIPLPSLNKPALPQCQVDALKGQLSPGPSAFNSSGNDTQPTCP
jgi:hypothetical protein